MLGWNEVGQFVLVYPESHLFTIAIFILLGRYAGYRITELWRFRDLVTTAETTPMSAAHADCGSGPTS